MMLKCKMCGGDMRLSADKTYGVCEYCGSLMTLPKAADARRVSLFNRGNQFRMTGDFDQALSVYEQIVRESETDAEAHWCCALCRFGIEYVEDPSTHEYIPTCHRASFDNFLEDVDYQAALTHSEGITRRQYQKDAARIAEVQRGILATSQNEAPFDVFVCYKETDERGMRTKDSVLAQEIYYRLTEQGYRVFFSRITLEDKVGSQYEPYIFAALNSARVMIVVGTSGAYLNAPWVKNEWSRFLALMRRDHSRLLLPCYRDMDPYDLPEQLGVLQSYDMSRIGFLQDLLHGVSKVLDREKPPAPAPAKPPKKKNTKLAIGIIAAVLVLCAVLAILFVPPAIVPVLPPAETAAHSEPTLPPETTPPPETTLPPETTAATVPTTLPASTEPAPPKKTIPAHTSAETVSAETTAQPSMAAAAPAHVHSLILIPGEKPTCTQPGKEDSYRCSGCGELFRDADGKTAIAQAPVLPATGHMLGLVPAVPGDCTTDGTDAHYFCIGCYAMFRDAQGMTSIDEPPVLAASGHKDSNGDEFCDVCKTDLRVHTLSLVPKTAATCTQPGTESYYRCSCGDLFADANGTTRISAPASIPATGHRDDGTEKCALCGVNLHEHSPALVAEVPASCLTDGTQAYYRCSCGQFFADAAGSVRIYEPTVIPAKGHQDTNGDEMCDACKTNLHTHYISLIPGEPATCTVSGYAAHYRCSSCGVCFADENGKSPLDTVPIIPATGHSNSLNTGYCAVCGERIPGAHVHAESLTYQLGKPATCTEAGMEAYYVCSCGRYFADAAAQREIYSIGELLLPVISHVDANNDGRCDVCYSEFGTYLLDLPYTKSGGKLWIRSETAPSGRTDSIDDARKNPKTVWSNYGTLGYTQGSVLDRAGVQYTNGFHMDNAADYGTSAARCSVTFTLNGRYSTLTGYIGCPKKLINDVDSKYADGKFVNIYVDGVLRDSTPSRSYADREADFFTVDVRGAQTVRFEFPGISARPNEVGTIFDARVF